MSYNSVGEKQHLLYNPSIDYQSEYYSESDNIFETSYEQEEVKDPDRIEDIEDIIESIEIGVSGLPEDIKDLINGVIDPIIDFIEDNKDYIEDTEIEEDEDFDDDYEDDTEIDDEVNFIPIVNIIDSDENKKESIKKTYKDNILDLFDNYLKKIKSVIDNYWINMGVILIGKPIEYKAFILNDIDKDFSVDKKNQHLLDFAIRSQIHKKSKASYACKIFPVDETLTHLRSLKVSTDLMLRYLETNVEDATTEYGNLSKAVLDSCIVNYNNKYNYTYRSIYKYLNSSIELTDEVLQLAIQEAKAKKFLK